MDDDRPSGSVYQGEFLVPHDGGKGNAKYDDDIYCICLICSLLSDLTLSRHREMFRYIVQTVYYTNNPDAPAAFYQCYVSLDGFLWNLLYSIK